MVCLLNPEWVDDAGSTHLCALGTSVQDLRQDNAVLELMLREVLGHGSLRT